MVHGEFTKWKWLPYYPENIKLGYKTDIGALTCLFGQKGIDIGDYVQIGSHCSIYSANTEDKVYGKIIIKDEANIGSHCTIFPNVIIERKEKIKAHSVVYVDQKGKRHIKEVREYK